MRIGILGPLEVTGDSGQPVALGGSRLRALLIRLAVDAGQSVSADLLAEDLWAGEQPADAANALQALVSRLRQAAGRDVIESRPGGYRLAVDRADVDAFAFERQVTSARAALAAGDPGRCAASLADALALWRGPALADVAEVPFAAAPAARLEELRLAATEDRIDAELALGRGAGLVPETEELATRHPLRERLRGQFMRALYAAGRQADALAVFEETRRLLAESLGVDPSPDLSGIHLAILRGDPALLPAAVPEGAAAREPAAEPRLSNLPAQLTSFVGREEEIERAGKLLAESRLVTLTGPGGSGKTRLAIEAAAGLVRGTPDGVWFVPLAPVRDPGDVAQAVLTALGITERLTGDSLEASLLLTVQPLDRLADALASKRLTLVLDNAEHLLDAIAGLVGRVLAEAPGVRILATSREPLGITGETLCPVPSLPLPPDDAAPGDALGYASIRLFADRAAAARPGFAVSEGNVTAVIGVCRALDGIPLAIELAAARLRALTLAQVAGRLSDRFGLLAVGSRTAMPRHQTLRAIVDWSWELLDDAERTVLRRLSVFDGGATPASAEQVCALDGDPPGLAGPDGIIDVIASLVDKSLVTATGETEVRYRLLETVRAYSAERLAEAGEQDRVRAAHAGYFLALAEQAEPQMRSYDQMRWLQRLTAEHDNFSAALRFAIDAGDTGSALRFVAALAFFWIIGDHDTEAGRWAAAAAELTGGSVPAGLADEYAICIFLSVIGKVSAESHPDTATLRDALQRAASVATTQSRHPLVALAVPAAAMFAGDPDWSARALRDLAGNPDPWIRAAGRAFSGHVALNYGRVDEAAEALADARERFQLLGDRWGSLVCLVGLAEVAMARGDPAEAARILEESRGYAIDGVSSNWCEMMLIPLGRARAALGDTDGARADLERGIRSAERLGEQDDEVAGYLALSDLARADGDLGKARGLLERAREIAEPRAARADMSGVAAATFSRLGCLAEQQADLAAAACWHERALGVVAAVDVAMLSGNSTLATVVEGLAALAAARGGHARAAELLGLAHALHGFRDGSSLEVTRATEAVTAAIGDEQFAAAYERGRRLSRADALALRP